MTEPRKRLKQIQQAGTIEKLVLQNFMCHDLLEIDFITDVNFIIGQNGSGKSAILTALMIALGGKANATNRATTLKGLIKTGHETAKVTVKIRNTGDEPIAFMPLVYGPSISVERVIQSTGASTYKVKTHNGKTIGTRHEDVQKVLDFFQIEVDNPLTILTQDTARMFLANSTAKDKYQFFMKGTQLDRLKSDYKRLDDNVSNMQKMILLRRAGVEDLKEQLDALQSKWNDLQEALQMESRINNYRAQQIWSKVEQFERKIEDHAQEARVESEKAQKASQAAEKVQQQLKEILMPLNDLQQRHEQLKQTIKPFEERANQIKFDAKKLVTEKSMLQSDIDQSKLQMESLQRELHDLTQRIQEETRKLEQDRRELIDQKNRKMEQFETQRGHMIQKLQHLDHQQELCNGRSRDMQQQMQQMELERRQKYEECKRIKHQIDQYSRAGHSNLGPYGGRNGGHETVQRVLQEIDRIKWQGSKPIGPFGLFVKIKQEHRPYQKIIETLLQNTLNAMGVESNQDSRTLVSLLQKHRCDMQVFVYDRRKFDYTQGEAPKEFLTVLRCLNFTNEIVKQQLIIHNNIERMVLVENDRIGDEIVARGIPRNVSGIFTQQGQRMGSSYGGLATTSTDLYRGPFRLSTSNEEQIAELKKSLPQAELNLRGIEQELDQLKRDIQGFQQQQHDINRQRQMLRPDVAQLEAEIELLKASMVDDEPGNISAMEEARFEKQTQLERLQSMHSGIEQQLDRCLNQLREMTQVSHQLKSEKQALQDDLKRVIEKMNLSDERRMQLEVNLRHYTEKQKQYQDIYENKMYALEQLRRKLNEKIAECEQEYERCPVEMSEEQLEAEIRRLSARIREQEQHIGSRDQIAKELMQKRTEHDDTISEIEQAEDLIQKIKDASMVRNHRYEKFKSHISIRAMRLFANLVHKRGYRGELELDHQTNQLYLHVDVDNGSNVKASTSTLSGGEKSYATICFLISMWHAMPSKLRCLDEFDVFMDAVNRKLAMKLIIDNATSNRESQPSQYILITPQAISQLEASPYIRIRQLHAPERGQQRLPFKQIQD
ncbi:RecF/RecN/SMC [Gorgonomyces haynaldii]|nr:RecF/RecN/SMC [Gorgonomyces haynaldii]